MKNFCSINFAQNSERTKLDEDERFKILGLFGSWRDYIDRFVKLNICFKFLKTLP
jgi:hypothetical protein